MACHYSCILHIEIGNCYPCIGRLGNSNFNETKYFFFSGREESVPAVTLPASAIASSHSSTKIEEDKVVNVLVISLALYRKLAWRESCRGVESFMWLITYPGPLSVSFVYWGNQFSFKHYVLLYYCIIKGIRQNTRRRAKHIEKSTTYPNRPAWNFCFNTDDFPN